MKNLIEGFTLCRYRCSHCTVYLICYTGTKEEHTVLCITVYTYFLYRYTTQILLVVNWFTS